MTGMEWVLWVVAVSFYITCLFTGCAQSFQKGHTVLSIVGIFFPFLWSIGAILPARKGSRFNINQQTAQASQIREYTQ